MRDELDDTRLLHLAVERGDVDAVGKMIEEGVDPNVVLENGENAFVVAARTKFQVRKGDTELPCLKVVRILSLNSEFIEKNSECIELSIKHGNLALYCFFAKDLDIDSISDTLLLSGGTVPSNWKMSKLSSFKMLRVTVTVTLLTFLHHIFTDSFNSCVVLYLILFIMYIVQKRYETPVQPFPSTRGSRIVSIELGIFIAAFYLWLVQVVPTTISNSFIVHVLFSVLLSFSLNKFYAVWSAFPNYALRSESDVSALVPYCRKAWLPLDRFCGKCLLMKQWDLHHCSQCQKCVVEFDHHCHYVDNCITPSNLSSFVLFLIVFSFLLSTSLVMIIHSLLAQFSGSLILLFLCLLVINLGVSILVVRHLRLIPLDLSTFNMITRKVPPERNVPWREALRKIHSTLFGSV